MRKLIISLLIIFALLALISVSIPLGIGLWLEHNTQPLLKQISSSSNIHLNLIQFNRGWFRSTATINVTLKLTPNSPNTIRFVTHETIHQGPWIIYKNHLNKNAFFFGRALVISQQNTPTLNYRILTFWTLGNQFHGNMNAPLIQAHPETSPLQLQLHSIQGTFAYNPNSQTIQSQFSIGSGQASTKQPVNQLLFTFNQLALKNHFNKQYGLWSGQRTMTLGRLNLFNARNERFSIQGFSIKGKSAAQSLVTNITLHAMIHAVNSKFIHINTAKLTLHITELDTQALAQLTQQLTKQRIKPNTKQSIFKLYQSTMALAGKGLAVELNPLTFNTPKGAVHLTAQLSLPKQQGSPQLMSLIFNSRATATLKLPKTWLIQLLHHLPIQQNKSQKTHSSASNTVDQWIKNHMFIQHHKTLQLNLKFNHGKLRINDRSPAFNTTPSRSPST